MRYHTGPNKYLRLYAATVDIPYPTLYAVSYPDRNQTETAGKERKIKLQLLVNQQVSGSDLAELLQGDSGTYLCQNNGQTFIVEASPGHSIASIRPALNTAGSDQWQVQKISSQSISAEEFSGDQQQQQQRSRSATQGQQQQR